ncbi:MAG: 6-phosphogluconolactonase [Terrimicrobiaceae bacterium]|nr:6-phosphogluconolactonase [Terrimicrobiaceae bacterium]
MTPEVLRTRNFGVDALAIIERAADAAIFERGEFRIGLSGGNTPRPVYEALARSQDAWEGWIFTFGDERCVPPDHPESNYRMVRETLLDLKPVPLGNILRIRGEEEPRLAAAEYEQELRRSCRNAPMYCHDLLLLGMGDDGHTASLFPGTEALGVTSSWAAANFVPRLNSWRVTLTLPVLNAARHVCFLVHSAGKEEMLRKVLAGDPAYPAARVRPEGGNLTWLIAE